MSQSKSDLYEHHNYGSPSIPGVTIMGARPILPDRSTDKSREWQFFFQAMLQGNGSARPVMGEVPGKTLAEALKNLESAMEARRQEIIDEITGPRIIVPGVVAGKFGNG